MIETIKILIPKETEKLEYLVKIIEEWSENGKDRVQKPKIEFDVYQNVNPQISFDDKSQEQQFFRVGKLDMGFNLARSEKAGQTKRKAEVTTLNDKIGDYLLVKWPNNSYYQMNFERLYRRLHGHIKSLDHVGVNISPRLMAPRKFEELVKMLVKSSFLLASPENEKWLFIMPEEKKAGQMFEVVGDFKYNYPEIQVDIQTDLTEKEAMEMFPPPYGYHDQDSGFINYCVRVFIYTGWRNTSLRIDVRYLIPNFKHEEWLVKNGKRILAK